MKAFTQGITKSEFLTEIKMHQKLDNFVKGRYWENGKGCAVGCSLESVTKLKNIKLEHGNHREMENHLGVPTWLAHLEDKIFENVSVDRSKTWPVEFAEAINEGADLNKIKIPFLIFLVEFARTKTNNEKSLKAIDYVLIELKKDELDIPKLKAAAADAAAAYAAAAYADAYAAYAAYAAAYAYDAAAYAANTAAAYAANAAAAAAAAAADAAAAYADAYKVNSFNLFADKLLELIRDCEEN